MSTHDWLNSWGSRLEHPRRSAVCVRCIRAKRRPAHWSLLEPSVWKNSFSPGLVRRIFCLSQRLGALVSSGLVRYVQVERFVDTSMDGGEMPPIPQSPAPLMRREEDLTVGPSSIETSAGGENPTSFKVGGCETKADLLLPHSPRSRRVLP